ncbi:MULTISPECIES: ATP-binding cassette domain-containing protein [unclassified Streptomyces]|uniref:ATP-binding cassette domain-containing protein n=1 Tax=unclassified Streptomyces TaxID=2593676 RepID=UPI00048CB374|nr:ATP-binding cassette domain-containing protein [Streptomyces sp. DpondAA-D4]MYY14717.1 ATP-binding cassette domain-containing protein [Streptomyces sp. SID4912]SCD51266.1 ABC transporter [Streptomyces sp. DpondAA-D4]
MDSPHGAAVSAEGFGLKGPRGWVFRGVGLTAPPGSLVAVEGPSGSGRTCLLLALTGRMRPTEGHAEVGGARLPGRAAAVRAFSALGPVPGVSELDPAFTVAEHLRERALLRRRFDGSPRSLLRPGAARAASRAAIDTALDTVGLDLAALPKAERTSVRDLERLEALRLSLALALMGRPRLLAVDDTDLKLSGPERAAAWRLLRGLADDGTTVLAVCGEAPEGALTVRTEDRRERTDAPGTTDAPDTSDAEDAPDTSTAEAAPDATATTATEDTPGAPATTTTGSTTNGKETADALTRTGRA